MQGAADEAEKKKELATQENGDCVGYEENNAYRLLEKAGIGSD